MLLGQLLPWLLLGYAGAKLMSQLAEKDDYQKCILGVHENLAASANITVIGLTAGCQYYEAPLSSVEEASTMLQKLGFGETRFQYMHMGKDCRGIKVFPVNVRVRFPHGYENKHFRIAIRIIEDKLQLYFPPKVETDLIKHAPQSDHHSPFADIKYVQLQLKMYRAIFTDELMWPPTTTRWSRKFRDCSRKAIHEKKCFTSKLSITDIFQIRETLLALVRDKEDIYLYQVHIEFNSITGEARAYLRHMFMMPPDLFPNKYSATANTLVKHGRTYIYASNKNDVSWAANSLRAMDFYEILVQEPKLKVVNVQPLPAYFSPFSLTHEYAAVHNETVILQRVERGCDSFFGVPNFVDNVWFSGLEFISLSMARRPLDSMFPKKSMPEGNKRENNVRIVYISFACFFILFTIVRHIPQLIEMIRRRRGTRHSSRAERKRSHSHGSITPNTVDYDGADAAGGRNSFPRPQNKDSGGNTLSEKESPFPVQEGRKS
ncbi:unnamed protein product, partial [Mesorhabditis spiculigera]